MFAQISHADQYMEQWTVMTEHNTGHSTGTGHFGPRQFGPQTLWHYFDGSELSGHFGTGAEVSFGHFGSKCRSVLPLGLKCPDPRCEVSLTNLLNCVERFYVFVSVMPFVCLHAHRPNHIGLFKLHQIFAVCYVCTRLRCYGCAATLWMFFRNGLCRGMSL